MPRQPTPEGAQYRNPFRAAKGLRASRIDQGVDYAAPAGQPIYALGKGTVDQVYNGGSGWPGGGWVSYVLDEGPAKGQRVYVAEDVTPAVKLGQKVTAGTVVARFNQSGFIETGWAGPLSAGDQTLAAHLNEWDTSGGDPGRYSTEAGVSFSNLLASTGAPAGTLTPGGIRGPGQKIVDVPVTQVTPDSKPSGGGGGGGTSGASWLDTILYGIKSGFGLAEQSPGNVAQAASGLTGLSGIAQAIAGLTVPFVSFARALDWFFVPSHRIRVLAGIGGGVLTAGGIFELAHTGRERPTALPLGIGMTGVGAVLLFVAFHNLDPSISSVGGLLSDLQGRAQAGTPAGAP